MNEMQSQTGMITTPEGLYEFAGVADPDTRKKIAVHVALFGVHAATISMLEGHGVEPENEEIKYQAMETAENFEELGKLLTSYDVRLSMVPQLQILFFVQWENKAILPLTAGIINGNVGKVAENFRMEQNGDG